MRTSVDNLNVKISVQPHTFIMRTSFDSTILIHVIRVLKLKFFLCEAVLNLLKLLHKMHNQRVVRKSYPNLNKFTLPLISISKDLFATFFTDHIKNFR